MTSIGHELLDVPIDKMIGAMANAIGDAQMKLDQTSIALARMMSGSNESDRVSFGSKRLSLFELGLSPSFYQFVDTLIEVKMSISLSRTRTSSTGTAASGQGMTIGLRPGEYRYSARGSSVNAVYASKYPYSAEGASLLRTKLAPVPAPGIFEDRIRAMIEQDTAFRVQQPDALLLEG